MKQTGRRIFLHDIPEWCDPETSEYFITICCKQGYANQLCLPGVGPALLESVRFYQAQQKWFPWLSLLMLDHLHAVITFGRGLHMEAILSAWKRHAAAKYGIIWQQGFFEHRLRRDKSVNEKADYIRQNPIRAGLASEVGAWPFFLENKPRQI